MTRWIVPAALSLTLLGAPVLAAGPNAGTMPVKGAKQTATMMTPAQKCSALEKQFDAAIKKHGKADKAAEARTMRTQGGELCANGKRGDGVARLESALKGIGVKPKI